MKPSRQIRLRYAAVCRTCRDRTPAADRGHRGIELQEGRPVSIAPLMKLRRRARALERGYAGGSAGRRYEHLRERRETQVRERWGRLSGLYLALTDEPQSTRSWATGSSGERKLGASLDTVNDDASLIVLHDRRIPGSRTNIDHVVISAAGIFVVDAKRYSGKVRKVDRGGWLSTDFRLYVGERDRTKLIPGLTKQVEAVRKALGVPLMQEFALAITRSCASSTRIGTCSRGHSSLEAFGSSGRRVSRSGSESLAPWPPSMWSRSRRRWPQFCRAHNGFVARRFCRCSRR